MYWGAITLSRYRPPILPGTHYARGPSNCRPLLLRGAPHGRPRGLVWTRGPLPRGHVLCASCAPRGTPRLCHVASAPRRTCVVVSRDNMQNRARKYAHPCYKIVKKINIIHDYCMLSYDFAKLNILEINEEKKDFFTIIKKVLYMC